LDSALLLSGAIHWRRGGKRLAVAEHFPYSYALLLMRLNFPASELSVLDVVQGTTFCYFVVECPEYQFSVRLQISENGSQTLSL
jgi:hypothetical protein